MHLAPGLTLALARGRVTDRTADVRLILLASCGEEGSRSGTVCAPRPTVYPHPGTRPLLPPQNPRMAKLPALGAGWLAGEPEGGVGGTCSNMMSFLLVWGS